MYQRLLIIIFLLLSCSQVDAQKRKEKDLQFLTHIPVQVDGDIDEWQNQLSPIDQDSSWSFAVSTDPQYIYVALVIRDQSLVPQSARYGIKVNVNPQGKKRDGAQLFFPTPDAESLRALANEDNLDQMNVPQELIKRSRGYNLYGFARIVDGSLSLENTYGVIAKAKLTDQNTLIYESRIPISAIGIEDLQKPIAIGIEINTQFSQLQKALKKKQNQRTNRYARGNISLKSPYKMKTEIWILDVLNKN